MGCFCSQAILLNGFNGPLSSEQIHRNPTAAHCNCSFSYFIGVIKWLQNSHHSQEPYCQNLLSTTSWGNQAARNYCVFMWASMNQPVSMASWVNWFLPVEHCLRRCCVLPWRRVSSVQYQTACVKCLRSSRHVAWWMQSCSLFVATASTPVYGCFSI